MSNRLKVVCAFVILAAIGYGAALAAVSYLREDELTEFLEVSVESDLRFRLAELETYRDTILTDANVLSNAGLIRSVIGDFSRAFDALGADPKAALQRIYISDNPYPAGTRDALMRANDASDYSRVHALYHGWLRAVAGSRDYLDLMLVRSDGTVIYSVAKQDSLGGNLRTDADRYPALAKLFNDVMQARPEVVTATPFERIGTDVTQVTQFIGVPIFADGSVAGALIIQLGVDRIFRIVHDQGLAQGNINTYIALSDGRNLIRPGAQPTDVVKLAIGGAAGTRRATGIDGRDVFAAYAPLRWIDGQMVLVSEFDMKVADKRKYAGLPALSAAGVLLLVLAALGGWLLGARDPD